MAKKEKPAGSSGTNVPDGNVVLSFVSRVENLNDDLSKERSAYMLNCKSIRADIKEVKKEAKAAGIRPKALAEILKQRKLEADLRTCGEDLEGEDSDSYAASAAALEKLGELGAAALAKAA